MRAYIVAKYKYKMIILYCIPFLNIDSWKVTCIHASGRQKLARKQAKTAVWVATVVYV